MEVGMATAMIAIPSIVEGSYFLPRRHEVHEERRSEISVILRALRVFVVDLVFYPLP
jgi:hypothetical protein